MYRIPLEHIYFGEGTKQWYLLFWCELLIPFRSIKNTCGFCRSLTWSRWNIDLKHTAEKSNVSALESFSRVPTVPKTELFTIMMLFSNFQTLSVSVVITPWRYVQDSSRTHLFWQRNKAMVFAILMWTPDPIWIYK